MKPLQYKANQLDCNLTILLLYQTFGSQSQTPNIKTFSISVCIFIPPGIIAVHGPINWELHQSRGREDHIRRRLGGCSRTRSDYGC